MNPPKKTPKLYLGLCIWLAITGVGFWNLLRYSNTPGKSVSNASLNEKWPAGTQLHQKINTPTLVIFAHPRCPCSVATIGELERLIPHIHGKITSQIVFFNSKSTTRGIEQEKLWKKASSIPGVQVVLDKDGSEMTRFGAQTSGQTFLYDSKGILAFHGGITPQRGDMGDNLGRAAILAVAKTGITAIANTPVFGCSLKNPERKVASDSK